MMITMIMMMIIRGRKKKEKMVQNKMKERKKFVALWCLICYSSMAKQREKYFLMTATVTLWP